jgi:hypothetical protein
MAAILPRKYWIAKCAGSCTDFSVTMTQNVEPMEENICRIKNTPYVG